jgi:hypothetical protein
MKRRSLHFRRTELFIIKITAQAIVMLLDKFQDLFVGFLFQVVHAGVTLCAKLVAVHILHGRPFLGTVVFERDVGGRH